MHSVACVGFKVNFLDSFSSNCVVIITLFITITSDVLIKIFKNLIISISYMQFSRYMVMYHSFELCILFNWLNFYQSLENWNLILNFNSLITGKTSYHNSTSLLMSLAPISCCSSFACIYMNLPNICSGSASCSSIFYSLAATYSPAPSPVKYHRPLES